MTADMDWTPPNLVKWIADDLTRLDIPGSRRLEAEQLVAHALGISRLDIYLQFDKPCTAEEQAAVRELVVRRRRREPVAYIMQTCDFRSVTLSVGPGVLTPRSETELLVEAVLMLPRDSSPNRLWRVLELGTGSAAIPVALATEGEGMDITATEIDSAALVFAVKNVDRHQDRIEETGCRIDLLQADRFEGIARKPVFDCIISNPPYIRSSDIPDLQEEVRDWEPVKALDGGVDGLDFYRYLKSVSPAILRPGGFLVCEHGFDQQAEITGLMSGDDLQFYSSTRDYAGHDRILTFQKT